MNMQMIIDSLDMPTEHVVGNPGGRADACDVYPFLARPCDAPEILYLQDGSMLHPSAGSQSFCCAWAAVRGGGAVSQNGIEGLILKGSCDPFEIFRSIRELFTKFELIERRLLNTLIENRPIRDILNACAMFMECHVSLYGADFTLLGYSDVFLPGENDSLWQQTVAERKCVVPMIPREKMHVEPAGQKENPRSSYIEMEDLPNLLNIGFDFGDSRIATMVFCQVEKPLNAHHQWLSDYIADIVHPVIMERYNTFLDVRNYFRTSVATALRYANTESTFLLSVLTRLGWSLNEDYQIILIRLPQETRHVSHLLYNYENVFAGSYSDCIALRYEDYIVILLHGEACDALKQRMSVLNKQLVTDNGICSIGLRFCDFTQLKLQYDLSTPAPSRDNGAEKSIITASIWRRIWFTN